MVWAFLASATSSSKHISMHLTAAHSGARFRRGLLCSYNKKAGMPLMPQGSTLWCIKSKPYWPLTATSSPCSSQYASTRHDIKTAPHKQPCISSLTIFCACISSLHQTLKSNPLHPPCSARRVHKTTSSSAMGSGPLGWCTKDEGAARRGGSPVQSSLITCYKGPR